MQDEQQQEPAKPPVIEQQWSYRPEQPAEVTSDQQLSSDPEEVSWTASEFIAHEKSANWFVLLAIVAIGVSAAVYFLTQDIATVVVILIVAIVLGIYARRQPRVLQYAIDHQGIRIGDKLYTYDLFKSFAVMEEGVINSIQLMPLKRFMPPMSMYFAPDDEDRIVSVLGEYLPVEQLSHDMVERLMRKIRF